ncbi:MAG: DivIVA domain-containing protein [Actinobacteria bacterium]|nr:DivIVA domain-containing protein [Actinomycetota bacterium]
MELTLKRLLEQAEFSQAKRGYDRDEVNDFLDRAVAMATKVEAKLTQTMDQAKQATEAALAPADIEAEVDRRVEARLAEERAHAPEEPPAPTGPSDEERAEEMSRTLVLAQRTADAAIREAREEAERLRADATAEAAQRRRDLDQELEDDRVAANERVRQEIAELEGVREALRTDVGVLERHVEEQRNQLRSTVGELQRLLEDPNGFRLAPAPALLDPEVPAYEREAPAAAPPVAPSAPTPVTRDPEPELELEPESEPSPEPTPEPEPPVDRVDVPTEAAPAVVIDEGPEQGGLSFGDVEHDPPAGEASSGDPFMDELRKAMSDDEPLGPRDVSSPSVSSMDPTGFDDDDDRKGWRFGKRR